MTMKWMISFQSGDICSVNNPRNAFQFPCINSFIQKREFLKRDIWDQTKCRVLWNWNFKMHLLFIPCLLKKKRLKHIKWIHLQKASFINHFFPFILRFPSSSGKSWCHKCPKDARALYSFALDEVITPIYTNVIFY